MAGWDLRVSLWDATAAVAKDFKCPEVKLPGAAEQTQLGQGAALGWILTKQKHQSSRGMCGGKTHALKQGDSCTEGWGL